MDLHFILCVFLVLLGVGILCAAAQKIFALYQVAEPIPTIFYVIVMVILGLWLIQKSGLLI